VKDRIERSSTQLVTVACQLFDDAKTEYRLLGGMVEDMQPDESGVQVFIFHLTFSSAGTPDPGGTVAHSTCPSTTAPVTERYIDFRNRKTLTRIYSVLPVESRLKAEGWLSEVDRPKH